MTLEIPGAELTGLKHLEHMKRLSNATGTSQSTWSSRNPQLCLEIWTRITVNWNWNVKMMQKSAPRRSNTPGAEDRLDSEKSQSGNFQSSVDSWKQNVIYLTHTEYTSGEYLHCWRTWRVLFDIPLKINRCEDVALPFLHPCSPGCNQAAFWPLFHHIFAIIKY